MSQHDTPVRLRHMLAAAREAAQMAHDAIVPFGASSR